MGLGLRRMVWPGGAELRPQWPFLVVLTIAVGIAYFLAIACEIGSRGDRQSSAAKLLSAIAVR